MTDQLDRLNTALSDRYSIEREIGSGGMATVYLAHDLKHNGLLIVDSGHVQRMPTTLAVRADLTAWAVQETEREITANVLALGFLVGLTGIVSRQALCETILARAPAGTQALNLKALERGYNEAETLKASA